MKLSLHRAGLAISSLALVGVAATVASPAEASYPPPDGGGGSTLSEARQLIVNRANAALVNPKKFKLTEGGTTYNSTVLESEGRNLLEIDGSNRNINQYTGFHPEKWCGDFAAAMWTGINKPDSGSEGYGVPNGYSSSQAWAIDPRFHDIKDEPSARPTPGDVLVWQDNSSDYTGHVGVVVAYSSSTGKVTTVEGNINGDEIARRTYSWTSAGPVNPDKHFRGFLSRTL